MIMFEVVGSLLQANLVRVHFTIGVLELNMLAYSLMQPTYLELNLLDYLEINSIPYELRSLKDLECNPT